MGGAIGWIGAIAGAFLGATVAQLIGQPDMTVPLAIAGSFIGGADFALALVDEIEQPAHRRARFTVAY